VAFRRDEPRWRTRFGSWVGQVTVQAIVAQLGEAEATRVTPNAVYQWLAGHSPSPTRAGALVRLSRGQLTYEAIYAHRSEMRALVKTS
jgi:hypothetical protein